MKALIVIALLIGGGIAGWHYSPDAFRAQVAKAAEALGLAKLSPFNLLPPLRAKILPESPVTKRAALIDQIEKNIRALVDNQSGSTLSEKVAFLKALADSQDAIAILRVENSKNTIAATAFERILDTVLPQSSAVTATSTNACAQ